MSVAHTAVQEWMVMGMAKRDLITKDFALYVVHYFNAMQTWNKEDILSEIDRTIKEAKPEDAVPVVRCKDCKHFMSDICYFDMGLHFCRGDDFCSYGEPKGERKE